MKKTNKKKFFLTLLAGVFVGYFFIFSTIAIYNKPAKTDVQKRAEAGFYDGISKERANEINKMVKNLEDVFEGRTLYWLQGEANRENRWNTDYTNINKWMYDYCEFVGGKSKVIDGENICESYFFYNFKYSVSFNSAIGNKKIAKFAATYEGGKLPVRNFVLITVRLTNPDSYTQAEKQLWEDKLQYVALHGNYVFSKRISFDYDNNGKADGKFTFVYSNNIL